MNKIQETFGIKYPIIQGGMIWCSGWKLASAVSIAGGLGLIGAGSMTPDLLREHIRKCKAATNEPFGVNLPLIYTHSEEMIQVVIEEGVKVVFTSAGNPAKYTKYLKDHGLIVAHVVANVKFALKCQDSGVDAVVAEGFEAGGHNGREETTTLALIPQVRKAVSIPLIAAGGIATGAGMLAAMALGADGVQIGSRFAASEESSAHDAFKKAIVEASDGSTVLTLKRLIPVRLIWNRFTREVEDMQTTGVSNEALLKKLGSGRARLGMFDGDTEEGELEIGQVSGLIDSILPVNDIIQNILSEYKSVQKQLLEEKFIF